MEAAETGVDPVNGVCAHSLGDAVVSATTTLFDTLDVNDDGLLDSVEFSSFEGKDGITADCIPGDEAVGTAAYLKWSFDLAYAMP